MIKHIFLFILFLSFLSGCRYFNNTEIISSAAEQIEIRVGDIEVEGDLEGFEIKFSTHDIEEGLREVTMTLSSGKPATPPEFTLKWSFPSIDVYAFWNTNINLDKATYYYNRVTSRASSQAPVICFMNSLDRNRFTFALSDALNKIITTTYLREEDIRFHCHVRFFSEPHPEIREYKVKIRFDSRDMPFYSSLGDVTEWWAGMPEYKPAEVPETACMPLYSTWYSFHQNLDADGILKQCKLSREIGLEAVIIDDGWQTLDNQRGYAYTGDWESVRIPNIRSLVDSIHMLNMKFILWYSLPFIGEKSKNFENFKGKYLTYWEGQGTWVLDPRYPEVREHIIRTYEKALKEWNLDGFKLDFLGWFTANDETTLTAADGRDYASVNDALDRLMTDIMVRLKQLNPDVMIEFRQPYIGPLMRKYGNMFRAADCPNMEIVNRVRTADLRILSGNTAVHSDMFRWHADDKVESAALQILNIIFSVPQLSVKLDSIPAEHFEMARFWIGYWKENRDILLEGDFVPVNPSALYPLLHSTQNGHIIAGLYNDFIVSLSNPELNKIDIINAKGTRDVVIDLMNELGTCKTIIYDCLGNIEAEEEIKLKTGIYKFNVPPSGMIRIGKI